MYGFEITIALSDADPDALSEKLDEITDQIAATCAATDEFKGYMITERADSVGFLITTDADDEVQALSAAISWLHSAVHAAGFATPGWLKRAEQVFDGASTPC